MVAFPFDKPNSSLEVVPRARGGSRTTASLEVFLGMVLESVKDRTFQMGKVFFTSPFRFLI